MVRQRNMPQMKEQDKFQEKNAGKQFTRYRVKKYGYKDAQGT